MANQMYPESDPRSSARNVWKMLDELVNQLHEDIQKVDDTQARALFSVSVEVLLGLQRSFKRFEDERAEALR